MAPALALVAVLGLALFFAVRERTLGLTAPESTQRNSAAHRQPELDDHVAPDKHGEQWTHTTSHEESRSLVEAQEASRVRLEFEDGEPVAFCSAQWTSGPIDVTPNTPSAEYWSAIEESTIFAESDTLGKAVYPISDAPGDGPLLLWLSHERAVAESLLINDRRQLPSTIRLQRAPPVEVRVIGTSGAVAVGATVLQYGIRESRLGSRVNLSSSAPEQFFFRRYKTNEEGLATVHPWKGEVFLFAELAETRSTVFRGQAPSEVLDLRLRELAQVKVATTPIERWATDLRGSLSIYAIVDEEFITVGNVILGADGKGGPIDIPIRDATEYAYHLSCAPYQSQQVVRLPPKPGELVDLEFALESGRSIEATVLDSSRNPVEDANVTAYWSPPNWLFSSSFTTSPEGSATITGVGQGLVQIAVTHPDFDDGWEPVAFDATTGVGSATVVLTRSGLIRGVVLASGEPVKTFTIDWWTKDPYDSITKTFEAAEDGRFEIDGVPIGLAHLMAWSDSHAQSVVTTTSVRFGESEDLRIELPSQVSGSGIVVDATTRRPVPTATIQSYTNVGIQPLRPTSEEIAVDATGRFTLTSLAPRDTVVLVRAEGYATQSFRVESPQAGSHTFGQLALHRSSHLTVQLFGAVDPDQVRQVSISGRIASGPVVVTGAGEAQFTGCSPGLYYITVADSSGQHSKHTYECRGEGPWNARIDLPNPDFTNVQIHAPAGNPLKHAIVRIDQARASRLQEGFDAFVTDGDGKTRLPRYGGQEIVIEGLDLDGHVVGIARTSLPTQEGEVFTVRLEQRGGRVRVVDEAGIPCVGGTLTLHCPEIPQWFGRYTLDQAGETEWSAPPCSNTRAFVKFGSGYTSDVSMRFDDLSPETQQVVADMSSELRIQFLDGETPVNGFRAHLHEDWMDQWCARAYPDGDGRLVWQSLGRGRYTVRVDDSAFWPIEAVVHASPSTSIREIQIRRTGELAFQADDTGFDAGSDLYLRIASEEFGDVVEDWILSGRVISSSGSTHLTATGQLSITDLPNGTYSWSLLRAGIVVATGVSVVPPFGIKREVFDLH